jgi:hypothetical protein
MAPSHASSATEVVSTRLPLFLLLLFLIVLFVTAFPTDASGQGRQIHVTTTGDDGADGLTWSSAFASLSRALDEAGAGDEVWMAVGVYTPLTPGGRQSTFTLRGGVRIYGGFGGNESDLSQRTCGSAGETVLSGWLGSAYAYHVVSARHLGEVALLDCLVIEEGSANGPDDAAGGGLYSIGSEVDLAAVTFRYNSAAGCGGGFFNGPGSRATLSKVRFESNRASRGAGICNDRADPDLGLSAGDLTLFHSTFDRNVAASFGGGIENRGIVYVEDGTFQANRVRTSSTGGGGALFNAGSGVARIARSLLKGNDVDSNDGRGGAVYQEHATGSLRMWSSVVVANRAGNGGALFVQNGAVELVNLTIGANEARRDGGAMFLLGGTIELFNSILWNNTASYYPEIYGRWPLAAPKLTDERNIITGGCPGPYAACIEVIEEDPLFDASYGIPAHSPAVDGGLAALYESRVPVSMITGTHLDAAGNARIGGAEIDLGAFEQSSDADGDGVADDVDECPATTDDAFAHPRPNHWYLEGGIFVQVAPAKSSAAYTIDDTRGCSCLQIVAALELGKGHRLNGCSNSVMETWVAGGAGKRDGEMEAARPDRLALAGNYPNPFNPVTTIRFDLPERADVRLVVYDMLGREVRVLAAGSYPAGFHEVRFEAEGLATGPYVYRLTTPAGTVSRLMTLLR